MGRSGFSEAPVKDVGLFAIDVFRSLVIAALLVIEVFLETALPHVIQQIVFYSRKLFAVAETTDLRRPITAD